MIRDLEKDVKIVMENCPGTRNDDMLLYYEYFKYIYADRLDNVIAMPSFEEVFINKDFRVRHKIANFASVERCRRKIQHDNEELRGVNYKERQNKQHDFINYAFGVEFGE